MKRIVNDDDMVVYRSGARVVLAMADGSCELSISPLAAHSLGAQLPGLAMDAANAAIELVLENLVKEN